jgi:hypothetical protein
MTHQVRKTRLEEGDELPTHEKNIIYKRVVTESPGIEDIELMEATTQGIEGETKLEVWYIERMDEEYE